MRIIITLTIAFLSFTINAFAQVKESPLKISHLEGDFYIYITSNIYKGNPVPANGMYLVTNAGVVMFDTPWDTTQFQPLLDSIKSRHNKNVVMCIATHSHGDRTGGLEFLDQRGVQTYTTKLTDSVCKANKNKRAKLLIVGDTTFTVGQYSFQTYYAGPGHTIDNIVLWFDKDKILYGGCLIKSFEAEDLGYLGEAYIKEWPKTLKKIQAKFKDPRYVIPGHDDWTDNSSLQHTLELLSHYKNKD